MLYFNYSKERSNKMYLRILKKDLKRKKTMNVILFIFIILAAMFIASSANNMTSVMTALDGYFEKAQVPDYWFVSNDTKSVERFESFAEDNGYDYEKQELLSVMPSDIKRNGGKFEYSSSICLSSLKNSVKIFDKNDDELTTVKDGDIYVTAKVFYDEKTGLKEGDKIKISSGGKTKEFTLRGCVKDAEFGGSGLGMTRMLISENDFEYLSGDGSTIMYSLNVFSDDPDYSEKFTDLDLNTLFGVDKATIKTMYFMDTLIAVVILIVSVCLILISMVILRFTINFTMSEEFREIGVMKAIGIPNRSIRGLYIVKYLGISAVGAAVGFALSIPFSRMLMKNVSRNIVISNSGNYLLNLVCVAATAAIVVLFCYFCTRRIKKFTPVDAIRNGENGERYSRKSIITLGRSHIAPVPFMAVNDIFSGLKRFITMILIFTLGLLLIIIPVNTINTLQSDSLITMFNMAECDHVISQELFLSSGSDYKKILTDGIDDLREKLDENGIEAEVFQETMFRMTVTYNGKKASSLAFQSIGGVTTDRYAYLEGTPPQNEGEIALSQLVADRIGADIGDTVQIRNGEQVKEYMITATLQSMNNMGEGIRFYPNEELDYSYTAGCFGIQVKYKDSPDSDELARRKDLLKEFYPDNKVYTAGEYISYMIGDVVGQLQGIKYMILAVVLCINVLVTVLMVKSFITKEKGEIAVLKAVGFRNSSLVAWQTLRIGIVLLISIVIGTLLSTPLSKLTVEPIFKMLGAVNIKFDVVPSEVYVLYPLIVLAVTTLAGFFAALQVRKISASETSNIE